MYNQSASSNCFALSHLISTSQIKRRSWRNRCERSISFVANFINKQGAQLNKVKGRIIWSICSKQLFLSLRAHQASSHQGKILKDQNAQTTDWVVSIAYRLWLHFCINRVLSLTKLRGIIYNQSVGNSCLAPWELIRTAQIKRRSRRTKMLKPLLELWALDIVCGYLFYQGSTSES